jgi:hypothetical protein
MIMQFRKIIAAGILGLLIALWQQSLLAVYLTCLGCMLMYAFRMFSLSIVGRGSTNDVGDPETEQAATPSKLFAASLRLRHHQLKKPSKPA